jgi:ABC-2 type transport system ATP-binding protein
MAVVGRSELVFVDEPTAGMDPHGRRAAWSLLEELRADGVTVVLTTHHMDEAERLADRIHILDHGRLVASGTADDLTDGGARPLEDVFVELTDPRTAP